MYCAQCYAATADLCVCDKEDEEEDDE